jgi:glyoxylase-like metal-dependent hydrolase (beta-lactamase superfamily II)|tara:strand:- start:4602 stop:5507 length:906 start_codon:yes stop_codon:yes gene_type:complete
MEQEIGPVTILFGYENGKYPDGNAILVKGAQETVVIDPCLGVVARKDRLPRVDRVFHSHAHEDHLSGSHLFADVPWYVHGEDLAGVQSLDGMMAMYGVEGPGQPLFRRMIETQFNYMPNEDARTFSDGDRFDLGGVTIEVLHTPGHTGGHCAFIVDWGDAASRFVFLGDIELTGFGPYYGDACSSLESFETSVERLRHIDARWWLTFHHKGLFEPREHFLERLDEYAAVIQSRERRLLEFLVEPHSMDEIVAHRFVYRPGADGNMIENIERRSMERHLERLMRSGAVVRLEGPRYLTVAGE